MNTETLTRLSQLGVATVYEASGCVGLIDLPLMQLIPNSRVAGPARTVLCGQDDNLMVHAVIEQIQPGEVLILSMPEPAPVALIGELLATQIKVRKAAGILVDAAIRDVNELIEMGLPIWTRYIRAKGATKTKIGALNQTLTVGGASISTGDIIVLDAMAASASNANASKKSSKPLKQDWQRKMLYVINCSRGKPHTTCMVCVTTWRRIRND